ncbi:MAG TPA: GAF domain-containing protein, partial [Gammaproteobacteria bacterium]|nr:GAF domain-containing protein [Gammaproteobacteria bacterium]
MGASCRNTASANSSTSRPSGYAERVSVASSFSSADFMRRFRLLILLAWLVPPLFGSGFLLLIDMFSLPQMLRLLATPLELGFILGWLLLSQWCFGRLVRPLADWLAQPSESAAALALARMRAFPRFFWGMFLFYLLLAPASVIFSAEMATDFEASSGDWLRVHLVALIVSIIVGLPVFFAIFDLFGRAFGGLRPPRPVFSIRTKVFMVGALMPLLAGALLVLYYWTRTGYFSLETLFVWIGLQLLAMLGALMFARSLGQSLQPLEAVVEDAPALLERRPSIRPSSSDELGVLTGRYQDLLERLYFHGKALQVGGLVLAARDVESASGKAFEQVVALCREALRADIAFLLLFDEKTRELVGVVRTDVPYRPEGYDRFPVDATSLSAYVFRQGELVVIDDARGRDDPRVNREMAEKFGLHAAIAVPLRVEDRVIGVLMG